jgi:glutathione S-transferase
MINSANFYTMSILYPLVTRATYPRLSFAGYPGEVSTSEASDEDKEAARKSAEAELPRILDVYRQFFIDEAGFIGGDKPSIADIRLASTLEFLAVTDTELPSWAQGYKERVESALGDAYSEPAADVRGYIAQVTGQAAVAG